ncbi:MAG: hypothetical protein HKN94_01700 [Acidimicrobiales bacterium]|nr:hypothetical protein [Acidimicrobiales bacterium]
MSYLEEAFQRLDGLSQEVDALASPEATAELEARIASFDTALIDVREEIAVAGNSIDERVSEAEAKIAADVGEVQTRLQEQVTAAEDYLASEVASVQDHLRSQVTDTEQQLAEQVAEAREFLTERLDMQDAEIDSRLAELPQVDRLADLESSGAATGETLQSLSTDMADLAQVTQESQTQLESNASSIAAQAEEISLVAEQVDVHHGELTGRVTAVDEHLVAVDEHVISVNERISSMTDHVSSVDDRVAGLDERINEVNDHVHGVDDRVAGVDERINEINNHVHGVDDRVAGVDDRMTSMGEQLSDVVGRIETQENSNERIQALAHDAELSNETAGRVTYLSERIAEITTKTDATDSKIHQIDGRLVDSNLQIEELGGRIGAAESSLDEFRDQGVNHVSDLAERFADTDEEVKTNSAKLRNTRDRLEDVEAKAEHALEHNGATDAKIVELRRRTIAAHDRIDDTVQQLTELRTHTANVTEQAERATDAAESIGDAAMRIAEAEVILTSVKGQSDTALQRADDAHQRIESLSTSADLDEQIETVSLLISEHVEEQIQTNEDLVRRVEEAAQRAAESSDLAQSAKTQSDEATSRADDAHEQIAELISQLDVLREELDASDGEEVDGSVSEKLDELEAQLTALDERVAEAATMSNHTLDRFDETADQIVNLQQTSATALTRASEATEQLERLHETVSQTELPSDLLERVDAIEKAYEHQANYVDPAIDQRISEAEEHLTKRIEEARAELARQAADNEQRMSENVTRVEGELATQVADARSVLTDSVSQAQVQLDEQIYIEDPEGAAHQSIAAIRGEANLARQVANEAYQFSENLRVLQTDLVKAIQQELGRQSTRLVELEGDGRHNARFADLEHQVDGIGSSIATLTELQSRSTNLDSTLTESVTHMTKSLEESRSEVETLKANLAAAMRRIDTLELQSSQPQIPRSNGADVGDDDDMQAAGDDEADWFTESVSKKAKKKRFGK